MLSLRDTLESALVEDPDDLATHYAYADYLQERGDPRGDFIQVQLALEDPDLSPKGRWQLESREQELLAEYGREWLGVLADELLGPEAEPWDTGEECERPYEYRFARGWLDRLIVHSPENAQSDALIPLLGHAPELRLLRELILDCEDGASLLLPYSPVLTNLRRLQIGSFVESEFPHFPGVVFSYSMTAFGVLCLGQAGEEPHYRELGFADFLSQLRRLEELYLLNSNEDYDLPRFFALPNLNRLRVLHVCQRLTPYPLEELAGNRALGNLRQLWLHSRSERSRIDLAGVRALAQSPHLRRLTHLHLQGSDLGDVGCTEIVTSGILKRLKVLDLRHGEITDAGARTLADCPDLLRLEQLDIGDNRLTQAGIDALRRILGDALRLTEDQAV